MVIDREANGDWLNVKRNGAAAENGLDNDEEMMNNDDDKDENK